MQESAVGKELDVSRRQTLYRKEIKECREALFREGQFDKELLETILDLWKSLKTERKNCGFQTTNLRLLISKEDMKKKKKEEIRKMDEEIEEEVEERFAEEEEETRKKNQKYKKEIEKWKENHKKRVEFFSFFSFNTLVAHLVPLRVESVVQEKEEEGAFFLNFS